VKFPSLQNLAFLLQSNTLFSQQVVEEAIMLMFRRRDDLESPSPGGDVEEMKPTFRQLRSLNEAVAAEELVQLEVEEDDEQTVETEQIPGAFRAGPSATAENEESSSDAEEDDEVHGTPESEVESGTPRTVRTLEAKVVDDSMVEAEFRLVFKNS
jgi:hypothetical protein